MIKNEKQTLGEFFQEARKEKGISIDEIVRDTNIPKRYLESIESDNFDVFPGETYALGFVTNYADALEVDRDSAIAMYKRQMKIEQDSPIEQLVGKKKQSLPNSNIIIFLGIIITVIIIVLFISLFMKQGNTGSVPVEQSAAKIYLFSYDEADKIPNQKFKIGDTIILSNESRFVKLQFSGINSSRALIIKINNVDYTIKNGELLSLDADNNGTNDLGIELFNAKEKDIKLSIASIKESSDGSGGLIIDDVYNKYKEYILSESEVLVTKTRTNIDMKIIASGNGYVSYIPDNKEEKETYLKSGSSLQIPFNINLVLYLGNSGAIKIITGNKEEDGGGWGEVGKSIFYWKNKNGQAVLIRAILK